MSGERRWTSCAHQVELAASVITEINQPPKHVTIRLTRPNACSLPYDDLGLTLHAMLHASGIEPKAPANAVARVGARDGAAVRISETDVRQWPAEAASALKAHRLLVRACPARTVVCPGCEADCVMPVQTIPAGPREAARFIVCDKRSDINRVALTTAHVDQWKCDGEALARFVVEQLGLRRSRHRVDASGTRPLGLAAGDTAVCAAATGAVGNRMWEV